MFDELPVLHVRASADAVVFRPDLGCALIGKVHAVGTGHVALLVAGVFNATIFANELTPWYSCNSVHSAAVSWIGTSVYDDAAGLLEHRQSQGRHVPLVAQNPSTLSEGVDVVFRVKAITFVSGLMSLEGFFGPVA